LVKKKRIQRAAAPIRSLPKAICTGSSDGRATMMKKKGKPQQTAKSA
jgi:hypothetical protein